MVLAATSGCNVWYDMPHSGALLVSWERVCGRKNIVDRICACRIKSSLTIIICPLIFVHQSPFTMKLSNALLFTLAASASAFAPQQAAVRSTGLFAAETAEETKVRWSKKEIDWADTAAWFAGAFKSASAAGDSMRFG